MVLAVMAWVGSATASTPNLEEEVVRQGFPEVGKVPASSLQIETAP